MTGNKTPLELAFDSVVLDAGGCITSELPEYQQLRMRGSAPKDADYFFSAHETVAELKRLERDTFSPIDDPRLTSMTHDWVGQGLIPRPTSSRFRWRLSDLPLACQREVMSFLKRPLEAQMKEANKQIKSTKATLGLGERTRGLLLLASDGNRVLDPYAIVCLLARICKGPRFSAIHAIAYFTFEEVAQAPSIDSDAVIWIDTRIRGEGVPRSLLSNLHERWGKRLEAKFGRKIQRVDGESILADLHFLPKRN
jgi:hypothetical protein